MTIESSRQIYAEDQRTIAALTEALDQCMAERDRYRAALGAVLNRCEWGPGKHPAVRMAGGYGADISAPAIASILRTHGIDPESLGE